MPDFAQLAGIGEAFIAAAIDPLRWNEAMEVAARATAVSSPPSFHVPNFARRPFPAAKRWSSCRRLM